MGYTQWCQVYKTLYDRHGHWFLWRTGTDFLHLRPIQVTVCHSHTLFLLFSSNIPKIPRSQQNCLDSKETERCAPVLEPVSLFLLLQLSPSAGSCLSFSFSPPYALSSLHPTLSKRPGVSTGQLKPAYTPRPQRTHTFIHHTNIHKNQQFSTPHRFCNYKLSSVTNSILSI